MSDLFFRPIRFCILNVYLMKTANILVYGYITAYGYVLNLAYMQNYMRCLSQNKSDTKLCNVACSLRSLNGEDSDKYTLTIT